MENLIEWLEFMRDRYVSMARRQDIDHELRGRLKRMALRGQAKALIAMERKDYGMSIVRKT